LGNPVLTCVRPLFAALGSLAVLYSQGAPADPPSAPPGFGLAVSGLVDAYVNYTPNHPASKTIPFRNFDVRTNSFSLNMTKLAIAHDADPIGFRMDIGLGRAWDIFNFQDTANGFDSLRYLPQAYVSLKPGSWKGVQVDFGKFYTSAGAELTETHLGWNYSRGLLYNNGPYYHFGMRATAPVGSNFTAGVQVVNGWNNVEDNNSGKTVGLTGLFIKGPVSWGNNYYFGPEKNDINSGFRHFYDSVLTVSGSKASAYLTFDYGVDKYIDRPGGTRFYGIGMASKFQLTERIAFAPRFEFYNDIDGFITGTAQKLKEVTLTGEYKLANNFITRLEYRRDWSNQAIYERGQTPNASKNVDTVVLGMVFFFDNYKFNLGR
jgi:hypothetical protein